MAAYSEKPLQGPLSLLAQCSWKISHTSQSLNVYPDGFADLFVAEFGEIYVAGGATITHRLGPEFGATLAGIRLKACALRQLFGLPACEFTDRCVPLADLPFAAARRIVSIVRCADSLQETVASLCAELREQAMAHDFALARTIDFTISVLDSQSLASIAHRIGVTERHLHRLFVDCVGISPTRLRRIHRLQRVLDAMRKWNQQSSLADCALACGFADQAHLNRDVRELTGSSPARLLQQLHAA
jgi:AraC-like DNA-binding protein